MKSIIPPGERFYRIYLDSNKDNFFIMPQASVAVR